VHEFPSVQLVPSAAVGFEHAPLVGSHAPATWHWSDATQVTGFDPRHEPLTQASLRVHTFASLQEVPSAAGGLEHCPVVASQAPATWHWSEAAQVTGFVPLHEPAWHVSVCVQAFPSEHAVPSAAVGFEHNPVDGAHTPATWHWSDAVQTT
jgi:hypothetical protein